MFSLNELNTVYYYDVRKAYEGKKIEAQNPLNNAINQQMFYSQKKDTLQSLQTALINLKAGSEIMRKSSVFYSNEAFTSESKVVSAVASAFSTISNYVITDIILAKPAQKVSENELKIANTGSYSSITSTTTINNPETGDVDQNKKLNDSTNNIKESNLIKDGSLTINSKTITIDASEDTLNTVLSKINSLQAGVTATLENNKIVIQSTTKGENHISLGNDTANFFSTIQVATSEAFAQGSKTDFTKPLVEVADENSSLKNITSGYFNINGVAFEVDAQKDSLENIVGKINASKAGVTVFYDEKNDKLSMASKEEAKKIEFTNNHSNFITQAFGNTTTADYTTGQVTINQKTITIDSNTLQMNGVTFNFKENSSAGATVTVSRDVQTAKTEIKTFVNKFNTFVDQLTAKAASSDNSIIKAIEQKVRQLPLRTIDNPGQYSSLQEIGITVNDGKLSVNEKKLDTALQNDPDSVAVLFTNDTDADGLRDDGGIINKLISSILEPALSSGDNGLISSINAIEKRETRSTYTVDEVRKKYNNKVQMLNDQYKRFTSEMNSINQNKTKITEKFLLPLFSIYA